MSKLKKESILGVVVTGKAQVIRMVLNLMSLAIISRHLTHEEIGLVSMVLIYTSVALVLKDGGLSSAVIQKQDINNAQVSNLFWINTIISALVVILMVLAGAVLSQKMDDNRILITTCMLGVGYGLQAMVAQYEAEIKKSMKFKILADIQVKSLIVAVLSASVFAILGAGYFAMVMLYFVQSVISTFLIVKKSQLKIEKYDKNESVKDLILFGANLTLANLLSYLANNISNVIITIVGGIASLGLYNRATAITKIPPNQMMPPIIGVLNVALSKLQYQPEEFSTFLRRSMGVVLTLTTLMTTLLYCNSAFIVKLVLGDSWQEVIGLIQILSIFVVAEPVAALMQAALLSKGQSFKMLKWRAFSTSVTLLAVAVGGYYSGVTGVVIASAVVGALVRLPLFVIYIGNDINYRLKTMLLQVAPYVVIFILVALQSFLLRQKLVMLEIAYFELIVLVESVLVIGLIYGLNKEIRRNILGVWKYALGRAI
ncbi:oligosaccharide flippase family protein [Limnobacter sp. MED105]|uniref:oligosaccharide flippase family protein n=1 Tax=Limnobacter sp. MED105 TaxID=391597 RepID=UPI000156C4F1|nr:oligosaccharide flippase family protein [Limnobacter sp. MED105]EDM85034.1 xanthan biosynthesis oligosaccharidyl-lipid flippase GumJ [Limnobacter sp. MED105]